MLYYILSYLRRDGRVVEGAALEMLYRGNSIVGSNPTLSAIFMLKNGGFAPFLPHIFPKSIIRVAQSVLAPKEGKVGRHGQLAEQKKVQTYVHIAGKASETK